MSYQKYRYVTYNLYSSRKHALQSNKQGQCFSSELDSRGKYIVIYISVALVRGITQNSALK